MIAPRCRVCERWGNEAGGKFVQFNVTDPKEIEHNKQIAGGIVKFGHPNGNWFFCEDHIGLAFRYKYLTWNEAEPLIKKDFENGDIPKAPARIKFLDKVFRLLFKN